MPYSNVAGLILAGGTAERLGGARKGDLRVGGVPLLTRAVRAVEKQCASLWIVCGQDGLTRPRAAHGLPLIHDDGHGPAAALLQAAGMLAEQTETSPEWVLLAPGDAPFMAPDFVASGLSAAGDAHDAAVGMAGGRAHPTHALWRLPHLLTLTERTGPAENQSLFSLLDQSDWIGVDSEPADGMSPFFNVNTMADLLAANRFALTHDL